MLKPHQHVVFHELLQIGSFVFEYGAYTKLILLVIFDWFSKEKQQLKEDVLYKFNEIIK